MKYPRLIQLARFAVLLTGGLLFEGCAMAPAALGPLSGIQEVKTRAEVEREASHDPFPSPGDVGLK
jgi:hypothetical protein